MVVQTYYLWAILVFVLIIVVAIQCLNASRKKCTGRYDGPQEIFTNNGTEVQMQERREQRNWWNRRPRGLNKPETASQKKIEELLSHTYADTNQATEAESCPICLDPLVGRLSHGHCLHLMHSTCIRSWLAKDAAATCPTCRVTYVALNGLQQSFSIQPIKKCSADLEGQAHIRFASELPANRSAQELPTNLIDVHGIIAHPSHVSIS